MFKTLTTLSLITLAALTGCGGGGASGPDLTSTDTGSNNNPTPVQSGAPTTMITGYFLGGPVEGVTATADGISFVTALNGQFSYAQGFTVSYSIGGIVLGTSKDTNTVTATVLDGNTMDLTSAKTTNVLRFLQTLDSDANASNGIQISDAVSKAAKSLTMDFSGTPAEFDARPSTQLAVSTLTALTTGGVKPLVLTDVALSTYRNSMANLLSGSYTVAFDANTVIAATMVIHNEVVSSLTGTLPDGSEITGATAFDVDGTLGVSCTAGVDCIRMTVVLTNGLSAYGTYVNELSGAMGTWNGVQRSL